MPRVRFVGNSHKYNFNNVNWSKPDNLVHEVDAETWAHLRKQRGFSGDRLLILDGEAEEPTADEITAVIAEDRIGTFKTKESAVSYASDVFDIELDEHVSLDQLNQQCVEMKKRFDLGLRGIDLIENMRGAKLVGVEEDEVTAEDTVAQGPGIDPAGAIVKIAGQAGGAQVQAVAAKGATATIGTSVKQGVILKKAPVKLAEVATEV